MLTKEEKYITKCDNCGKEENFVDYDSKGIDDIFYFNQSRFLTYENHNFCSANCVAKYLDEKTALEKENIKSLTSPYEKFLAEEENKKKLEKVKIVSIDKEKSNAQIEYKKEIQRRIKTPKEEKFKNYIKDIEYLLSGGWEVGKNLMATITNKEHLLSSISRWMECLDDDGNYIYNHKKEFLERLPEQLKKEFANTHWLLGWPFR